MIEETQPPPAEPEFAAPLPERPGDPFWSYVDLAVFLGAALPALLLGAGVTKLFFWLLRWHPRSDALSLLPAQILGYAFLFGVLAMIFRTYGRPFWRSLGFVMPPLSPVLIAAIGCGTALGVSILGALIRTPQSENEITKLLKDPLSIVLMMLYGVFIAPLCEEIAFRGFLQPLLTRSFGVWTGIIGAAIPFGILHYKEYGNSWRHALLISAAGAAFGWMRHRTRSTLASVVMHSSYNGFVFTLFLAARAAGKM